MIAGPYLLKHPLGRPSLEVRRSYANLSYQAGSWMKPRRVVAKVEWHPGEHYPRVCFIVTNMARPVENVVSFYNKRGMCEQWIKEGKGAIRWTRLSYRSFVANAVRLQLHALAYNLVNFPTDTGDAGADQRLVADEPEGQADQYWREGRQPRPLCRLSDGGSSDPKKPLRRRPAAHRRTATTTRYVEGVNAFGCHAFVETHRRSAY
jgi:hypothetical protein